MSDWPVKDLGHRSTWSRRSKCRWWSVSGTTVDVLPPFSLMVVQAVGHRRQGRRADGQCPWPDSRLGPFETVVGLRQGRWHLRHVDPGKPGPKLFQPDDCQWYASKRHMEPKWAQMIAKADEFCPQPVDECRPFIGHPGCRQIDDVHPSPLRREGLQRIESQDRRNHGPRGSHPRPGPHGRLPPPSAP